MAYSTKGDLEKSAGGVQPLIELTADAGAIVADAAALARAISAADEWINSYLTERYAIPLSPIPQRVRETSADEAVYRLRKSRLMHTDRDREDHAERLAWLDDIARGRATLGTAKAVGIAGQSRTSTGTRSSVDGAVNRESTKGVW